MKNIRIFYLKIFIFLVVKFSIYLIRRVSVMSENIFVPLILPCFVLCFSFRGWHRRRCNIRENPIKECY